MTKIIVRREVLHHMARASSGQGRERGRPDSERLEEAGFAAKLALATAARGGKIEIEVVE